MRQWIQAKKEKEKDHDNKDVQRHGTVPDARRRSTTTSTTDDGGHSGGSDIIAWSVVETTRWRKPKRKRPKMQLPKEKMEIRACVSEIWRMWRASSQIIQE